MTQQDFARVVSVMASHIKRSCKVALSSRSESMFHQFPRPVSLGLKVAVFVASLSIARMVSIADESNGLKTSSASADQESQIGRLDRRWSGAPSSQLILTGGWKTEEISVAVKKKIKQLTKLLSPTEPHEIPAFVSAKFTSSELRPARLVEVFRDTAITVQSAAADQPTASEILSGPDRIRQVFDRLSESLKSRSSLSVRIKVVKIHVDDDAVTTRLLVQFLALGSPQSDAAESSTIQQDATWVCRWKIADGEQSLKLESIDVPTFQEIVLASGRRSLFSDCTESVLGKNNAWREQLSYGIDHWRARILKEFGVAVFGYQGCALGDSNGDGLEDVYVCQPGGMPNRLLVCQRDGTVVDRSAESRIDFLDLSSSALFVDLDNDGDQDLIVGIDETVVVLANDGRGQFTQQATLQVGGIPTSLSAIDYDGDSRLDFYVCVHSIGTLYPEGLGMPLNMIDANNGAMNFLFRNVANWQFANVTEQTSLNANNRRFSFAAAWEDFDNDGDPDLYVANEYGRNNLYRNDNGRFIDVTAKAGVEDSAEGMSVTWGDYNNDGLMDLYVSNMFSSAGNRIADQRRFLPGIDSRTLQEIQRHARGNSLFQNLGDGTFRDVSVDAGVTMGRWAWTSLFADLNNDGWEDIYVANGFITQEDNGDL